METNQSVDPEKLDAAETRSASSMANPGVIDLFGLDRAKNEVLLVMNESRRWDGGDGQLHELQEKFNAYASFILDGEMSSSHPELAGKAVRIELRCPETPEGKVFELLHAIHDQLELQDVCVEVVVAEASCGEGCQCHAGGELRI